MPADKVPLLLDTDPGSDIDDALALAYLLRQPACELLGVTTVTGEPEARAMLADAICRQAGRAGIPIFPGAARPLLGEQKQPKAPQARALATWPHRTDFPRCEAVDFMRETIRARPGEVTLLAIGPLTNVALLFALDPEIPSLLRRLVLMCGTFKTGRLEWNALVDPVAAAIVYQASVQEHISIGLDVTTRCVIPGDRAREEIRGGILEPVGDMAAVFLEQAPAVTFHDPLAAAVIFQPGICTYEPGRVEVELLSQALAGLTHWRAGDKDAPHRIAVDVDPAAFFDHYFRVVRN